MTLEADTEPGLVELQAQQLYADGGVVSWPVALTVTPGEESSSQNVALLVGVIALIGVFAIVAIAMLARRRRTSRTLQEK